MEFVGANCVRLRAITDRPYEGIRRYFNKKAPEAHGRSQIAPTREYEGVSIKKPLKHYASGTKFIAVPPCLLWYPKPLSDSDKSIADNGATVLHYCRNGFTKPTQEAVCPPLLTSARTKRRLSAAFKKGIISFNVFPIWDTLNHRIGPLSMG